MSWETTQPRKTETIIILIQVERNEIIYPKISMGLENHESLERRSNIWNQIWKWVD